MAVKLNILFIIADGTKGMWRNNLTIVNIFL